MEGSRWQRVQELFHAAADLPPSEQRAFLCAASASDDRLVDEVLALLAEDRAPSPIDGGVAWVARDLLDAAARPLPAARELGPYRILRLLGEGGMGVVYLAERTDVGSQVAIKILSDAWVSPARRSRFAVEERTLARLEHPSIARLYDAGALDDGTPFFVMEYVEGKPLTDHCRARAAVVDERLGLFRELCGAVQYAHEHAVIHRDIKPSNVLVKADGSVRLLDFGIAKHLEGIDAPTTLTGAGAVPMTPAYAAPEQLGGHPVGVYTDVYSLGVVLYELLCDRLPFDRSRRSPSGPGALVEDKDPDRPSAVARAIGRAAGATGAGWADLDVLVLTAMHRDAARRYRSVEALIRDLDHYRCGEPLEARREGAGYRLRKFVGRNLSAVALAAATVALVIGLVAFFTVRLAAARNAALAEAARTRRIEQFMLSLFTGGDDAVGPGKEAQVVTLLDRGLEQAAAMKDDPLTQADIYQTLGSLYGSLGERDRADSLLRQAIERYQAIDGPDSLGGLDTMVMLALLRDEQARGAEAEELLRKALAIGLRQHLPAEDDRLLRAREALGRVLTNQSRYAESIPVLAELVRVESAPGASPKRLSESLTLLANAHFYVGHYRDADSLNRRALALDIALNGAKHPGVADDLYNLGAVQYEWGHYDDAEKRDREALAITEAFYGRDHAETASGLTLLGRALVQEDKLDEAAPVLEEALAIDERAWGKVHPAVASTVGELGQLALKQGRLDDAQALFARQGQIYAAVLAPGHYLHAVARSNLGSVALARKDLAAAERWFREAVAGFAAALPADHPRRAIAEIRLGGVLLAEGRAAEAEGHSRAGYEVLAKEESPPARWITAARKDLAVISEALGQPDDAAPRR